MIKLLYKLIGFIFTIFIVFIFLINFNFLSYKESFFLRIYYAIKINFIYFLFYFLYVLAYFKFLYKKNK